MNTPEEKDMHNKEQQHCPIWVVEENAISSVLAKFLDQLDRDAKPLFRITRKTVPELFKFNECDTKYLWSLIEELKNKYHIMDIRLERYKSGQEIYENAQLRLNSNSETILRRWLNRPKTLDYKEQWLLAIQNDQTMGEQQKYFLMGNSMTYPEKSAHEVINALRDLESNLLKPVTLRALSARHFWGDSKFLDNRLEYLEALLPSGAKNIQPRTLLVNIYVPNIFTAVLFVENQDTFLQLINHIADNNKAYRCLDQLALVYSAGYKGAATRIRQPGNTSFSLMRPANQHSQKMFTQWWQSSTDSNIQSYFWGDLDYSGLAILTALRNTFAEMQAWKPGYDALLRYHRLGIYHSKTAAHKENQRDPGISGCHYADTELLPAIREHQYFIDQEIVELADLKESTAK